MSDATEPLTPEEEDLALAGEHALGLLEGEELRAFERRLAEEPRLRALVALWSEDLAEGLAVPEAAPPPGVEAAILRRLFPEPARPSILSRILPWAGGAVAAGALAFVLLVPRAPDMEMQARMSAEDESFVVMAEFDADAGELHLARMAGAVPEGRDYELWVIKDDRVRSLGVIPHEPEGVIAVSADLAADLAGGQLALSDEPPGGSPTGQATGPIVAIGPVTDL